MKVLSAFGYDGIELAGFFDHATVERYPDKDSRKKLVDWIHSHDLELVGYAPGPYGDFGKYPWATGGDDAYKGYLDLFEQSVQFCVDCGIPTMRVDPGDFGPLPRDADYDAAWNRVVDDLQGARATRPRARREDALGVRDRPDLRQAVRGGEAAGRRRRRQPPADVRRRPRGRRLRAGAQPGPARRAARGRRGRVRQAVQGQDRPRPRLRQRQQHVAERCSARTSASARA